jgi:hypothetical protein
MAHRNVIAGHLEPANVDNRRLGIPGSQLNADVLLMDEKRGREAARQRGLVMAGVLVELIHAKLAGWIPNFGEEIRWLRVDAGFFVNATIERFILSQVGE